MILRQKIKKLEEEITNRFIGNKDSIHYIILNLLHNKSTTLIRGPRGRGKSTLMILFLKGIFGDDFVVISGSSEIKRGEVVARLHIPSLEKEGIEKVLWSTFVKKPGKGIDELNRLNPYTAASIYHLLQFGEVWAYGQKYSIKDFILFANENPIDPTSFIHPPPFYDRFDISIYLDSLTLSQKFELQNLVENNPMLIEDMPQIITFDELNEVINEVEEIELDVELKGVINTLIRDFQACIRNRDISSIKPPALCEGCHFVRNICSSIRDGPSERATIILTQLAKAKVWLDRKIDENDVYSLAQVVLPHRVNLVRQGVHFIEIKKIVDREREINLERKARKQWFILRRLYDKFSPEMYRLAREIAIEDLVFAEELMALEEKWIKENLIKEEETLRYRLT
ncbi:MAG: AAA family ATPase [Thermoproteales archaeon]|nr:AAA family ATPase [Thermoproteales archaeon]